MNQLKNLHFIDSSTRNRTARQAYGEEIKAPISEISGKPQSKNICGSCCLPGNPGPAGPAGKPGKNGAPGVPGNK